MAGSLDPSFDRILDHALRSAGADDAALEAVLRRVAALVVDLDPMFQLLPVRVRGIVNELRPRIEVVLRPGVESLGRSTVAAKILLWAYASVPRERSHLVSARGTFGPQPPITRREAHHLSAAIPAAWAAGDRDAACCLQITCDSAALGREVPAPPGAAQVVRYARLWMGIGGRWERDTDRVAIEVAGERATERYGELRDIRLRARSSDDPADDVVLRAVLQLISPVGGRARLGAVAGAANVTRGLALVVLWDLAPWLIV